MHIPTHSICALWIRTACAIVISIGALTILGWMTEIRLLKSVFFGLVAMNPATAITLILSGISLLLLHKEQTRLSTRHLVYLCTGIVLLICSIRLITYLLGVDAGLDQVLFRSQLNMETPSNRMAPNTALCGLFVGMALLFLDTQTSRGGRPAQWFALMTLYASLLVLLGYMYSIIALARIHTIPMALHTAIAFALLSTGTLLARPSHGLMRVVTTARPAGLMTRHLLLASLLIPVMLGWVCLQGQRLGFYATEMGISLLVTASVAVFVMVTWRNALFIDKVDTERQKSEEAARQAQLETERANRAKSEFLSRMSHELRTPLNAILGFGQLLEIEDLNERSQESVEQILKGGRHLLMLINEVLDIARVEAGRIEMSLEAVKVQEVMQEVLDLVQPLTSQRKIQLRQTSTTTWSHYIQADHQRIKQVLLNLLSNAIKYNREEGEVILDCKETAQGQLIIQVTDTGQGIAPEMMERLFTPFDRLNAERTSVEGTGLGLALCKSLMEAMEGTLSVKSQEGIGSTFSLELPMAQDPLEHVEIVEDGNPLLRSPKTSESHTILYIEDNFSNLRLLQNILEHRPEVKLVSSMQGGLGVELACEHQPDLVLLDLNLPDIPGQEVLRLLQEDPASRKIPVIIISADATPGQIERLLAAGASAYLTKPIQVNQFLQTLDAILHAA